MTNDFNPSATHSAVAQVEVVSRQSRVAPAGILAVALVNTALGAIDYLSEFTEFVKWGVYAGEYLLLSIWFAWGPGHSLRRFTSVAWIGILWMAASWIGYGIAHPNRIFSFVPPWPHHRLPSSDQGHEVQQIFTIIPLAFAISSLPLWLMRYWKWGFQRPSIRSRPAWLIDLVSISIFALTTLYCFCVDKWVGSDLTVASIIGVLLGGLGLTLSPLLTLAFLGKTVRLWCFVLALACMPAPGLVFASVYPVPGAAGVGGAHYAYLESIVASSSVFIVLAPVFVFWRTIGIRHIER